MSKLGLIMALMTGVIFVVVSFMPAVRFADPDMGKFSNAKHCFHDEIYLGQSDNDVLMFGASRTGRAASVKAITKSYSLVESLPVRVFKFDFAWANPDMAYVMFRDYLDNNPPPGLVMVELMQVRRKPPPVRYVHPFFSTLAPIDLYLDVLQPNNIKTSYFFNLSDFARLLLRHIDLNLTNLLVADNHFLVPENNDCINHYPPRPQGVNQQASTGRPDNSARFKQLIKNKTARLARKVGMNNIGRNAALKRGYSDSDRQDYDPARARQMITLIRRLGPEWPSRQWKRYEFEQGAGAWDIEYYKKMVQLAESSGVEIVFYILPSLLDPEFPASQIQEIETRLGASVVMLPYSSVRVSYHFYRDTTHVGVQLRDLYATWFASEISKRLTN